MLLSIILCSVFIQSETLVVMGWGGGEICNLIAFKRILTV